MATAKRHLTIFATIMIAWAAIMPSVATAGSPKLVGDWLVTVDKDPFTGKSKSVAAVQGGQMILALRCFPDEVGLSAVLVNTGHKNYDPGTKVAYRYRADEGAISDLAGLAFGEASIELPNAKTILKDAQSAKMLYFQVELADETVVTASFSMRRAIRALQKVQADCGTADKSP